MLILTRRNGQSIMIGEEVKITVLGVSRKHVRIGIDAPREVAVHREEIHDLIQKEGPDPVIRVLKPPHHGV